MRTEDCVYGGEMSAHHYFKRFGYCDSGMIPWLLVAALVSSRDSEVSRERRDQSQGRRSGGGDGASRAMLRRYGTEHGPDRRPVHGVS